MDTDRISRLPKEILDTIVDHIRPDPEILVPVYHRRFLSFESLPNPPPTRTDQDIEGLGDFRLVCKRFEEIGGAALFTVIRTRFSRKDLLRLEKLAGWRNVARHVKHFSYLVPYFYLEAEHILHRVTNEDKLREFKERLEEQKRIQKSRDDVHILTAAFNSFTSLQVVKLLRVSDRLDAEFKDFVEREETLDRWAEKYWAPSCTHSSRAIESALMSANVDPSRYYIPAMHVRTLSNFYSAPFRSYSRLAASLTCLTIVFDDGHDLDKRITEVSPVFREVFLAAENMQAIHIGFPRTRPFNHPLEDIFHHVTWNKLLAFGIAGWCLHADEIISLARRHKERLKGLRLREVLLKEDSHWKDVLMALKVEMEVLEWLSLRRIGYHQPDEMMEGEGAEVPDDTDEPEDADLSTGTEESDEQSDNDRASIPGPSIQQVNGPFNGSYDSDEHHSSDDEEHGPAANATEFPRAILRQGVHTGNTRPNGVQRTVVDLDIDLDDNGRFISLQQRKTWEEWVVRHRRHGTARW